MVHCAWKKHSRSHDPSLTTYLILRIDPFICLTSLTALTNKRFQESRELLIPRFGVLRGLGLFPWIRTAGKPDLPIYRLSAALPSSRLYKPFTVLQLSETSVPRFPFTMFTSFQEIPSGWTEPVKHSNDDTGTTSTESNVGTSSLLVNHTSDPCLSVITGTAQVLPLPVTVHNRSLQIRHV